MASVFGISGLKSKLDSWWGVRKNSEPQTYMDAESGPSHLRLVSSADEEFNLSLVLENLVIPKLIAGEAEARKYDEADHRTFVSQNPITENDVISFSILSVTGDTSEMLDFVDMRLDGGNSVESIFVDLLAPAARRLGQNWEDDSGDFVDVTMGLWRIQEILRELTLRVPPEPKNGHGMRGALFSTMPGEQHSFGTLMVGECFERAGWDTTILIEPTQSALLEKAANRHFDLIGLTVTNDCPTATLASLVRAIKAVSHNPHVRILLGGRVINDQPGLVDECGADATAIDAPAAVALADHLVPAHAEFLERLI